MAGEAILIGSSLTGTANKYEYIVNVSGSSTYDSINNEINTLVTFSIQAIDKITGQECPISTYVATSSKNVSLTGYDNQYTINIGSDNNITIEVV